MNTKTLFLAAKKLGKILKNKKLTLATAESCTGGLVATAITAISGTSDYFTCGFITYSNEAKIKNLAVKKNTLVKYGAVSEEVAIEMALGTIKQSKTKISLAITGIAGPSGGSKEKPVGTVCFAWVLPNKNYAITTKYFSGDREKIRIKAAEFALSYLVEQLKQKA